MERLEAFAVEGHDAREGVQVLAVMLPGLEEVRGEGPSPLTTQSILPSACSITSWAVNDAFVTAQFDVTTPGVQMKTPACRRRHSEVVWVEWMPGDRHQL